MQMEVGSVVKGKVSGITEFGAFVRLEGGKTALIHISQLSDNFVKEVGSVLAVGQEVSARVLSVDEKGRIALTLKQPREKAQRSAPAAVPVNGSPAEYFPVTAGAPSDFEDMLHRFKTTSEERICDLKKAGQSQRPTRRKKGK